MAKIELDDGTQIDDVEETPEELAARAERIKKGAAEIDADPTKSILYSKSLIAQRDKTPRPELTQQEQEIADLRDDLIRFADSPAHIKRIKTRLAKLEA